MNPTSPYLCGQSHPISECLNRVLSPFCLLLTRPQPIYLSGFLLKCILFLITSASQGPVLFLWWHFSLSSTLVLCDYQWDLGLLLLLGDFPEDDGKGQGCLIPCCIPSIYPRPDSCSVNEGWLVNGWMNEWMWKERFHWVDAVVPSKHLLLLGYSVCGTKHPVCLPSPSHKLLEGRGWIIIIFSSPELGTHRNFIQVCGMKNELCKNGGAYLDFKSCLGMRVKEKQI